MAIHKILHFKQGSTGLGVCYNSSATNPVLQLPLTSAQKVDQVQQSAILNQTGLDSLETYPHTEEEIHQPKPCFPHVNQSILAIINIISLVQYHEKMMKLKYFYVPCKFFYKKKN